MMMMMMMIIMMIIMMIMMMMIMIMMIMMINPKDSWQNPPAFPQGTPPAHLWTPMPAALRGTVTADCSRAGAVAVPGALEPWIDGFGLKTWENHGKIMVNMWEHMSSRQNPLYISYRYYYRWSLFGGVPYRFTVFRAHLWQWSSTNLTIIHIGKHGKFMRNHGEIMKKYGNT